MGNIAKARTIIEAIRTLAPIMNDEEISDMAKVIIKITSRLEKENNSKED